MKFIFSEKVLLLFVRPQGFEPRPSYRSILDFTNMGCKMMKPKTIDFVITTNYSPYFKALPLLKKTIRSLGLISDLKTSFIEFRIIIAIDGLDPKFNTRRNKRDYQKYIKDIKLLKTNNVVISDCAITGEGWGHLS